VTRRLLASYLVLTLVLLVALEVPLAANNDERQRTDLTANLVRDAYTMAGYAEETVEGKGSVDLHRLALSYAQRTGARLVIVDRAGRPLADSQPDTPDDSFANRPEIGQALAGSVATGSRRSDTLGTDLVFAAVPIASSAGVQGALRVTYPASELDQRRRSYQLTLLGIAFVSLAAAGLLGLALARWVTRPIRRLEDAAADLGAGDLHARADDEVGPPEVRQLAHAFNQMAARLDGLVAAQASFVADASHQLRTPLAALQLRLENLQADVSAIPAGAGAGLGEAGSSPSPSTDLDADLDAALAETARLARLVDELLALARADAATPAVATVVDLDPFLADRGDAWAATLADRSLDLALAGGGLQVQATPDHLAQILDNLIANAADAAPEGTTIVVRAEVADPSPIGDRRRDVVIHVEDAGPGLDPDERARAFDRFWRGRPNRPGDLGGTGLGLAIARQLARVGDGDLLLATAPSGGLDAQIVVPASRAD
jgi:signal transduction histidine kinase